MPENRAKNNHYRCSMCKPNKRFFFFANVTFHRLYATCSQKYMDEIIPHKSQILVLWWWLRCIHVYTVVFWITPSRERERESVCESNSLTVTRRKVPSSICAEQKCSFLWRLCRSNGIMAFVQNDTVLHATWTLVCGRGYTIMYNITKAENRLHIIQSIVNNWSG